MHWCIHRCTGASNSANRKRSTLHIKHRKLTAVIDRQYTDVNRRAFNSDDQSYTHRDTAAPISIKSPKSSVLRTGDNMPRRFKVGDLVEGKHAALRNKRGRIIEVVAIVGGNNFKVRWMIGGEGTYSSRAIQFLVPAQPAGVVFGNNILPRNALAEEIGGNPRQNAPQRALIAYNDEYDDSSVEYNYGSR